MLRPISIIALVCLAPACSDESVPPAINQLDTAFVQSLMGFCAIEYPDETKIDAAVKIRGGKVLDDPSLRTMLGPESADTTWRAWSYTHNKRGYIVSLGEIPTDNGRARFCQVISEVNDSDVVASKLAEILDAAPEGTSQDAGQRTRIYKFGDHENTRLLTLLDADQMEMNMLNATILYNLENAK
ncbi:MAG: hypothetical protein MEP44_05190 [Blastomonas sp.]|nr:hypothetical protein [Blastomonas sp.]